MVLAIQDSQGRPTFLQAPEPNGLLWARLEHEVTASKPCLTLSATDAAAQGMGATGPLPQ